MWCQPCPLEMRDPIKGLPKNGQPTKREQNDFLSDIGIKMRHLSVPCEASAIPKVSLSHTARSRGVGAGTRRAMQTE